VVAIRRTYTSTHIAIAIITVPAELLVKIECSIVAKPAGSSISSAPPLPDFAKISLMRATFDAK